MMGLLYCEKQEQQKEFAMRLSAAKKTPAWFDQVLLVLLFLPALLQALLRLNNQPRSK